METVYDYVVRFIGDDILVKIVITEERDDIDHDEAIAQAENRLREMWGVTEIPNFYDIVNVDVYEVAL